MSGRGSQDAGEATAARATPRHASRSQPLRQITGLLVVVLVVQALFIVLAPLLAHDTIHGSFPRFLGGVRLVISCFGITEDFRN
ncbi:MAG TPA: hypothetical protein VIP09_08715 [Dehalococcoidia bacterium]